MRVNINVPLDLDDELIVDGNVGIGRNNPQSNLHIEQTRDSAEITMITLSTTGTGDIEDRLNILFKMPATGGAHRDVAQITAIHNNPSNNQGQLAFYTGTTGDLNEAIRITHQGRVGVGNVDPGYALDVVGDVNVSGVFRINGVEFEGGGGGGGSVSWSDVTDKPSVFPPDSHNHAAGDINSGFFGVGRGGTGRTTLTNNAVLVGNGASAVSLVSRNGIDTRTSFPPGTHNHSWSDITSGIPAFASRWPTWGEVTSKPSTFPPDSHNHAASEITSGTLPGARGVNAGSSSDSFVRYNGTSRSSGRFYGGSSNPNSSTRLNYDGNFYATDVYATSDVALKQDIEDLDTKSCFNAINSLVPKQYKWKHSGEIDHGLIAQDVEKHAPIYSKEKAVNYAKLTTYLIGAVKELAKELEITKKELENLKR